MLRARPTFSKIFNFRSVSSLERANERRGVAGSGWIPSPPPPRSPRPSPTLGAWTAAQEKGPREARERARALARARRLRVSGTPDGGDFQVDDDLGYVSVPPLALWLTGRLTDGLLRDPDAAALQYTFPHVHL